MVSQSRFNLLTPILMNPTDLLETGTLGISLTLFRITTTALVHALQYS